MIPAVSKILCCCATLKLNLSFFSFPSFSFSFLFVFLFSKIKDVVCIMQRRFLEQTSRGSDDKLRIGFTGRGGGGGREVRCLNSH